MLNQVKAPIFGWLHLHSQQPVRSCKAQEQFEVRMARLEAGILSWDCGVGFLNPKPIWMVSDIFLSKFRFSDSRTNFLIRSDSILSKSVFGERESIERWNQTESDNDHQNKGSKGTERKEHTTAYSQIIMSKMALVHT